MRLLVFDSGVGGAGVAREIRALLPWAGITYLMDNARFPYGGLTEAALVARVLAVIGAGIARVRPDLVVVACNSASTAALAALRARFDLPFVGCVPPVKWAASLSLTRTIGVLATPATVRGAYLSRLAAQFAPDCRMLVHGSPMLAGLAEDRFAGRPLDIDAVRREVAGRTAQSGGEAIDAVALGCTHYVWLLPELRAVMPPQVRWLDPAPAVARQVARSMPGSSDAVTDRTEVLNGLVLQTRAGGFQAANALWRASLFHRAEVLALPSELAGRLPSLLPAATAR